MSSSLGNLFPLLTFLYPIAFASCSACLMLHSPVGRLEICHILLLNIPIFNFLDHV